MAVSQTARMALTRWSAGTDPFTRAQLDDDMAQLEAKAAGFIRDLIANRPAAAATNVGFLFEATDEGGRLYWSTGSTWHTIAGGTPDVQTFTASGNWTKPAGVKRVVVELIGAGGSGANYASGSQGTGGNGGGVSVFVVENQALDQMGATVPVVVGAGGSGVGPELGGNTGGASSFGGTDRQVSGGQGGIQTGMFTPPAGNLHSGGKGAEAGAAAVASTGPGGGAGSNGSAGPALAGGSSTFYGNGGISNISNGTGSGGAGVAPGGGGGAADGVGTSGAGARGEVRVTSYFDD